MVAKRLTDLYILGQEVRFEVEGEPDIVVWLKKLQPFEQEVCMNRASIQRAKVLTLKKLAHDHEEVLPYELQVEELFSQEELVSFVAANEITQAYRSAEAKVADEETWAKDDYIIGLQQAWEEVGDYLVQDDFPEQQAEAKRVFDELKRFSDAVDVEFTKLANQIQRDYERKTDDELKRLAVEKLIDIKGDRKWLDEFKQSQIWLSTRYNKERDKRYFEKRSEVSELHPNIFNKLLDVYENMSLSPEEGKG